MDTVDNSLYDACAYEGVDALIALANYANELFNDKTENFYTMFMMISDNQYDRRLALVKEQKEFIIDLCVALRDMYKTAPLEKEDKKTLKQNIKMYKLVLWEIRKIELLLRYQKFIDKT